MAVRMVVTYGLERFRFGGNGGGLEGFLLWDFEFLKMGVL